MDDTNLKGCPTLAYPQMYELPHYLELDNKEIKKIEFPGIPRKQFHSVYFDKHLLILKMEGSFYSYRDWVASRLFQHLHYNTQSSILLKLNQCTFSDEKISGFDVYQQGILMIEQHINGPCSPTCDYPKLRSVLSGGDSHKLQKTNFKNTELLILKSLLSHFFSANESSETLIGKDHRFYLIDNSQMFSYLPTKSSILSWLECSPIEDFRQAKKFLIKTAKKISSLKGIWPDLCDIPPKYEVSALWDIKDHIAETIKIAGEIANDS